MGVQKIKWTPEEEQALRDGVAKYGAGKWKHIKTDQDFALSLTHRSNIDLKDKWRNISVGQSLKAITDVASSSVNGNDPTSNSGNGRPLTRYSELIFEALTEDSNGLNIDGIVSFIQQRQEIQSDFKRRLSSKLRALISQRKLEKIEGRYRIVEDSYSPKEAQIAPPLLDTTTSPMSPSSLQKQEEEACIAAASAIAEAEIKASEAREAIHKQNESVRLLDRAETMLAIANEIVEQCKKLKDGEELELDSSIWSEL